MKISEIFAIPEQVANTLGVDIHAKVTKVMTSFWRDDSAEPEEQQFYVSIQLYFGGAWVECNEPNQNNVGQSVDGNEIMTGLETIWGQYQLIDAAIAEDILDESQLTMKFVEEIEA